RLRLRCPTPARLGADRWISFRGPQRETAARGTTTRSLRQPRRNRRQPAGSRCEPGELSATRRSWCRLKTLFHKRQDLLPTVGSLESLSGCRATPTRGSSRTSPWVNPRLKVDPE